MSTRLSVKPADVTRRSKGEAAFTGPSDPLTDQPARAVLSITPVACFPQGNGARTPDWHSDAERELAKRQDPSGHIRRSQLSTSSRALSLA